MVDGIFVGRYKSRGTGLGLWIDSWFSIVDVRCGLNTNGLITKDVVDGGVDFEDKRWKEEVGSSRVAGEIAAFGELTVTAKGIKRLI